MITGEAAQTDSNGDMSLQAEGSPGSWSLSAAELCAEPRERLFACSDCDSPAMSAGAHLHSICPTQYEVLQLGGHQGPGFMRQSAGYHAVYSMCHTLLHYINHEEDAGTASLAVQGTHEPSTTCA